MRFKEKDEIVDINGKQLNLSFTIKTRYQKKINQDNELTVLKNRTLELQYKVFIWGVWVNFLNKINEKIEFELRNSNNKLKIRLSEEDKTVSSRNLKIRYFEVFFSDRKMDK